MKRLVFCLFLALTPVALPQEKESTGHEESNSDPWIWWKWANFAMLAAVLGYLANKSAGSYFRGQTGDIQRGIVEAGKLKAEAEARAAQIEKRLAGIEGEIGQLRSQAQTEMTAEAARLKDETHHSLERLQQQTQQELVLMTKVRYSSGPSAFSE